MNDQVDKPWDGLTPEEQAERVKEDQNVPPAGPATEPTTE